MLSQFLLNCFYDRTGFRPEDIRKSKMLSGNVISFVTTDKAVGRFIFKDDEHWRLEYSVL